LIPAQNDSAIMYLESKGTQKDIKKSKYWFEKATAQVHEDAITNLSFLK